MDMRRKVVRKTEDMIWKWNANLIKIRKQTESYSSCVFFALFSLYCTILFLIVGVDATKLVCIVVDVAHLIFSSANHIHTQKRHVETPLSGCVRWTITTDESKSTTIIVHVKLIQTLPRCWCALVTQANVMFCGRF